MKGIIIALLIYMSSMGQTIPRDKLMHFSSCYMISATSTTLLLQKYEKKEAAWIGFGIGATIGISKEIYDKYKNLIGVATLANPVLKEDNQDLTFKLKLDI